MAEYWASKKFIPFASSEQEALPGFKLVCELQSLVRDMTLSQHQVALVGAAEMLGALQYHYMRFMEIVGLKAVGVIPEDCPDERFEVVAYVSRLGQFYYFALSDCALKLLSETYGTMERRIPSLVRVLPFRHKYAAHRSIDQPKAEDFGRELDGELSLGSIGGKLFISKTNVVPDDQVCAEPGSCDKRCTYRDWYVAFQYFGPNGHIEFVPELEHPVIISECGSLMRALISEAKLLPRERA